MRISDNKDMPHARIIWLIIGIMLFNLICTFIYCFAFGRFDDIMLAGTDNSVAFPFGDYFIHLLFSKERSTIYYASYDACFPPLAYCFYYLLWHINPVFIDGIENWKEAALSGNNLIILLMCFMLLALLINEASLVYLKDYPSPVRLLFVFLIICSYPFMVTSIQRANAIAFVSVFLCFALIMRNSDNRVCRELSLILIAVCAGFKIYPAFAGILWLFEKRYKEFLRLVIYCAVLFLFPFVFFGGFEGIIAFLGHLTGRENEFVYRLYTIRGAVNMLLSAYAGEKLSNMIGIILETVFLIMCIFFSYKAGCEWKRILYIMLVLVLYVPVNWQYTTCYLLPVILTYIKENGYKDISVSSIKRIAVTNYLYAILLGIIFSLPVILSVTMHSAVYSAIYIIFFVSVIDDTVNLSKRAKPSLS